MQYYDGQIDQVSIWNIALSQQEIQNYMNCSPQGNEVGLVGYWNFEEGSGNTAYDQTSNGNDGIINGATYDTNVPSQSCSLTNANGCDSIAILNLTINQSDTSYTNITNCDSYTWSVNGTTYTQTGTYTDVSTNSSGCTETEILVLTINNSTTNTNYLPSNGLVGWWPFNGNANDESGNAYNGTVNGAALTTDRLGATNSAYSFNGNSAFIQTPTSAVNFPSGFTISVWAKVLGANTNTNCSFGCAEFLVTKGDDGQSGRISIQYSQDTGGETFAGATDYSLSVSSLTQYPFPQPNWHHVVYTFDNTNYKIYLDGLLMNTIASTTAIPNLASDIVFGKMPNNTSYPYYFNGYLDDIGIWNHALTPGEITNLYSAVNFASPTGTHTITECDAYTWIDGNTYTASNNLATFNITNGAASGCDSLVTLDLTIVNATSGTDTKTECNSYTWIDGNTFTASNNSATFNITNGAANGCDSLVTLDLTIVNSTSGTDIRTECNSYTWIDGNTFTASNNSATFNITNGAANGCDSLVTLDLTIVNATSGTDTRTECNSYTWIDGNTFTASNNSATFNITNGAANGCDSLVTLDLTIVNATSGTDTRTECNSYTWIDGNTYTASNNSATFNIVGGAANGCDSLVTLDLTIVNSTSGTDTRTECNSYTWFDGINYTASNNSATFNIIGGAASGCDSLVTLDLTIVNSTSGTDTKTECNSYTWIDGNTYTTSNNSATFNITNGGSNGCDSLVTLDLTIVNSTSGIDTRTECNSLLWIDGNTYYANNNTATFNIIGGASNLCDSLVTLDLTINTSTTGTDTRTECDSYTAPDGAVYTSTGIYTAIISNAANCDSTITIDLTVNNATASSISETALDLYTAPSGAVYTTSGVFNDTIANAAGCDSVISITLTMSHTGIEELNHQPIFLTPNPTSDFITIVGLENVTEIKSMELLSSAGRVVAVLKVGTLKIDVSRLSSGAYFLSITHTNGTERLRFVKE